MKTLEKYMGRAQIGAFLMVSSVVVVGAGFSLTKLVNPVQGVFGMTVFGGLGLILLAVRNYGLQGLNPWNLKPAQQQGMLKHAVTSSLMKIGGPVAFAHIGAGPYASMTATGSLLAGLALTVERVALRIICLLGVGLATGVSNIRQVSAIGIVAALAASTHPFNLPTQSKLMGKARQQAIAQANVLCMVIVLPLCIPLADFLGAPVDTWSWGPVEFVGMVGAGLLATAAAAVLQTKSSDYLPKAGMGAWSATAPALQPVVVLLMTPLLVMLGAAAPAVPSLDKFMAFGIVAAACALAALQEGEEAPREE